MTLQPAGKLGGCPFTITHDPDTGEEQDYTCLRCGAFSPPDRDEFLRMRVNVCPRAAEKAASARPRDAAEFNVRFASVTAGKLADNLTDLDFVGRTPTGETGFTADDVRAILAEKELAANADSHDPPDAQE